ncbi:glycosyltransferase family 39 protein [Candidatus Saccharibacteria bacterium]|nr:glycosyltransferase family 39 protein [Candidatus Saccharibacteria bacterium]MBQ3465045.1 glycosyltransferase family 39 protein [Candidatus Saccharibacteria bacterium]
MKREKMLSVFAPIIAGALFLVFSMLNLNSSIWFDESYSAYLVRGDFSQIWHETSMDVHPPFFYFALKIWSSIFGTTDISMRFMSIFFGLIAIIFLYQLLKRWFGVKPAAIATIVASVSPMLIRYGQEMRMYTMVLMIVFIATYFLSLALEKGTKREGRKYWIIYAVLVSIGMWTHYFSAFMWLSQFIAIIIFFGGPKKIFKDKEKLKTILLTYVLAILLFLPWIPSFFNQVKTVQQGFWIPAMSFETTADFVSSALFFNKAQEVTSWGLVFGLLLVFFAVLAYKKILKNVDKKIKSKIGFIAMMAFTPILVMMTLSLPPLTSSFVDRYVLYSIVSVWVLFGLGVALVKEKWIKGILAILIIIVATFGIVFVTNREPRGYVKEIMAEVFVTAEEGEPIIAGDVWTYYDGVFYTSEEHPVYLFNEVVNYEYGSLEPIRDYRVNLVDNAEEFLGEHEKVWYVTNRPEEGKELELPERFSEFRVVSDISLDHHVAVELSR